MPRTRLLPTLAAGALVGAALLAPAARADSISYVKEGNVFLTTPDGARTVQVTATGGYSTTSQADDGRILALHGSRLHLLSRWGDVLADFAPVGAGTAGSITLSGPFDPAISPDGTRVAYGFYVQYKSGDPDCGKPGGCMQGQLYTGTGYARSTGPADWDEPGFRPQYSWTDPSWIDDRQVLMAGPTSGLVKQAAVDGAGDGIDAAQWFTDGSVGNLYDGAMNRQRTAAAFIGNSAGDHLLIYRTPAGAASDPVGCLDAPAQGGPWSSPTWSPDGHRLAWAGPQGLYVAGLSGIDMACPSAGTITVDAFLPGARSPSWGPMDLPEPRPAAATPQPGSASGASGAPEQPAGTGSSPAGSADGATAGKPRERIRLAAAAPRRTTVLRRGLTVMVRCASGRTTVRASLGRTTIATSRTTCSGSDRRVTLRLTRAGRARLLATRRATITITAARATALRITLR